MSTDRQIVRRDEDGDIDDVVITGDTMRLERMSKRTWWIAVYRGNKRVTLYLAAKKKGGFEATIGDDDLGCIDDGVWSDVDDVPELRLPPTPCTHPNLRPMRFPGRILVCPDCRSIHPPKDEVP